MDTQRDICQLGRVGASGFAFAFACVRVGLPLPLPVCVSLCPFGVCTYQKKLGGRLGEYRQTRTLKGADLPVRLST